MTQENEQRRFRSSIKPAPTTLCVAAAIAVAIFLAPLAKAKDKDNPEDYTRVYQHTYDETFQAVQKAVERLGCSVSAADKEKGTIIGGGKCATGAVSCPSVFLKVDFQIQVETVSAKPETRMSVTAETKGQLGAYACVGAIRKAFKDQLLAETQKVLATY